MADDLDLAPTDERRGTWDAVLAGLLASADEAGIIDWSVSVDSTIARAHQHATNITRDTGGWVELHESGERAAAGSIGSVRR